MKIITCAGYYATGSSAITDFFSEFSNCTSLGKYEIRFIHDPNGIRDLEYNLIENNNRQNTSHAIKNFIKYTNHLNGGIIRKGYKRYFGNNFKKYTDKYIDDITELKCDYCWHYDQIVKGPLFNFADVLYKKLNLKIRHISGSMLELIHEKGYFSAISRELFYKYTKEYIENIINSIDACHNEFVMIDQLLPPSNIEQYLNYFEDIKVLVVDRDPRDLYIEACERNWLIPHKTVEEYCKWYEIIRRGNKKTSVNNNICFVQFEDMIYKYDEMKKLLCEFTGISTDMHINIKKKFDPDISINNTNLKAKRDKYNKEAEYIEKHLSQYLYDFSKYE